MLETVASQESTGHILTYSLGNTEVPQSRSYHELFQAARKAACLLRAKDAGAPGSVVLLHFHTHWDGVLWFWAAMLAGYIPALSTPFSKTPDIRARHLKHLAHTLSQPTCLTTAAAALEFSGQEFITPVYVDWFDIDEPAIESADDTVSEPSDADIAALMLTSGSTGYCKAVALTHGQILAAVAGKASVLPSPENTSLLNWIALDHVASLVEIHLLAIYKGRDQVHVAAPDVLSHPLLLLDMIDRHRVSQTFAPNFFLAQLCATLHDSPRKQTWDLTTLLYLNSGGEANVTQTCHQVSKFLGEYGAPPNVIVCGFGMTETCAGAIFNLQGPGYDLERSRPFASVGQCMPGIEMRVTDGDDGRPTVLARGTTGRLEVAGPAVFKTYFNNAAATETAFTADGWFQTGDQAVIDENGFLRLVGRQKDIIIVNGVKYIPQEIESSIDEASLPGVTPGFTCCFACFPPGGATEDIVLVYLPAYEPDDSKVRAETTSAIARVVMMAVGARPAVILPLEQSQLQKSALGKLPRGRIQDAYRQGEFQMQLVAHYELMSAYRRANHEQPTSELEQRLDTVFRATFPDLPEEFDVVFPILDLGISSIELIKLKKNIEEHLELPHEIPMVTLMTKPTVRMLADALRTACRSGSGSAGCSQVYDPVVELQSHGDKTPLWLVHPGVGEVMVFLNLAKFLVDRPVYALRARGFDSGQKPFHTIAEVVDTYHACIKETQPHGPYAIAGYSYGSMLAFEVGKVLEREGDEVAFLGSFNLPPHIKTRMRQLVWKECLLHLCYFLDLMSEGRARELSEDLDNGSGVEPPRQEILDRVLKEVDHKRLAELALSAPALSQWASVAFALQSMAVDYEPDGVVAGIDVFYCHPLAIVASSKEEWRKNHLSKWGDFTRSEPRFHEVGGAHYTMLNIEHVFAFQKTLRGALEGRGL
ncbi:hypothetical protein CNMCM7691_003896 [Aspergillus felis]|uniref:Carrier domain-containing protein n=1 Tax=Aspergillus felis TaxID=1287682 RepID=A0A8H6R4C9_9EURO|nr:hypothetical protein CNMCM7691_003896 [Aspergillus felis]